MQQPMEPQRAGTEHGSAADADQPGRPDATGPDTERPVDHEGPVGADGAQHPPTDRSNDPAEIERAHQGDVEPPPDEQDPRVSSVPLDTDDGDQVVISQQNAGPGRQVGGGEFKEPGTSSHHKSPEQADREQQQLEREAPTDTAGRADPGSVTHAPDGRSPGDRSPASRTQRSPS